ncbi:ROK family protein [Pseudonocardia kunmingensis]|uniref:Putative NBD/HSP70 family sugar kinase n=1 Tax=Pseudonocardia kunmingensis TaxID=630975 RepID=A0A543DIV1_9PSEU|nr:ROK family protein [Pseudonocardia kunmingensis]TQM09259.1 putative NBD/HSP70 family sugar kinase [Pseudonocardia kunmingensis]
MSEATAAIVELVATGQAVTRAAIGKALGWAPSTVSLRVGQLLASGVLHEADLAPSRGGRPGRILRLRDDGGCVVVADVGSHHARTAVVDLTGALRDVVEVEVDVTEGPHATLDRIVTAWGEATRGSTVLAAGLSLPGPVDSDRGAVVQASRMPGWNDVAVGAMVGERLGVPAVVENDANAMALGEHYARPDHARDSVTIKAGTAIGCGLVVGGRIYPGSSVGAGNITHTRVDVASATPCSCGNLGCLETVSSGAGIVRLLQARGIEVGSTAEVVRRAQDGDPEVSALVRAAGGYLGAVLCTVVNLVNPGAVYLGGALSSVEPFVAAVRGRVYEGSHPIATGHLVIDATVTGPDAGVIGMGRLAVAAAHRGTPAA